MQISLDSVLTLGEQRVRYTTAGRRQCCRRYENKPSRRWAIMAVGWMVGGGWLAHPFTFSPGLVIQREGYEHWVTVNFKLPQELLVSELPENRRTDVTRSPGRSISPPWKPRRAKTRKAISEPMYLPDSSLFSILVCPPRDVIVKSTILFRTNIGDLYPSRNRHEIGMKLRKWLLRMSIFIFSIEKFNWIKSIWIWKIYFTKLKIKAQRK